MMLCCKPIKECTANYSEILGAYSITLVFSFTLTLFYTVFDLFNAIILLSLIGYSELHYWSHTWFFSVLYTHINLFLA